jgi:hypothetical protein
MIRLQPTAISLSDAEVQTGLQHIMLRHTLITNLENLDIDCHYEYWDGETHEGSPSIDLQSLEHQKDENRLNQTTSAPQSDALQTSQANSTSILATESDDPTMFSCKSTSKKMPYQTQQQKLPSNKHSANSHPSTSPSYDARLSDTCAVENGEDYTGLPRGLSRSHDGQQFKPSEISKLCDTNLDLSFPRTPFSVLYFPTMYERTRLAGEAESEFTNDMPIKFPGASASSDQGERPLETAPSVAQETDNNPLKDPRTLTKSNDNTLLQPTLAWSSCDPHLWPHGPAITKLVLEESVAFRDRFSFLVSTLDRENDLAEDFCLNEVRSIPMGEWYRC